LYYISDGEQTSVSNRRTFSSLRAFVDAGAVIGVGSSAGGQVPVISLDSLDSSESAADETVKWVMDPTTNKPALSKMDKDSLTAIADEYSASTILLDASTTAKDLTIEASKDFQIASTPRKTSYTNYLIWPLALVELALMIWEAGIILSRFRRTI
jgi:Ca-activated chloride channel family protein